jgi:hypothetical protein
LDRGDDHELSDYGFCLLAEQSHQLAIECLKSSAWCNMLLLHEAAECGHAAIIPVLRDAGFKLNKFSPNRETGAPL